MIENCCLCKCFTELYFFNRLLVVSLAILIAVPFVFSRSWTSLAGLVKMQRVSNAEFLRLRIVIKRLIKILINKINSLLCSNTQAQLASPQTSFGVLFSRIHEWVTNEPQRTSAGRLEHSSLYKFSACQKWEPAGRIGDFGIFLSGFSDLLKAHDWSS